MVIIIPCYRPDGALLTLVRALRGPDPDQRIVLVDDGSGPEYAHVFDAARGAGCDVLRYSQNHGKGVALKRGLALIAAAHPGEDVVCADADGQHTPADIRRVAGALADEPGSIVLGSRLFAGDVPARSRYGNALARMLFSAVTRTRLLDTQTGLRGYPAAMLEWLRAVPGERYEYELEVLLAAVRAGVPIVEVPIATVYLDGNRSSHFRLPWDPIRVYLPLLKSGRRPRLPLLPAADHRAMVSAATGGGSDDLHGAR